MSRGGFREGAGRLQAPQINPLLSSLNVSQSLPRLIPRKHSNHSLMLREIAEQMLLECPRLTPFSTEPMASQRCRKKERLWTYRQ
jgi:hypothetical protein